VLHLGALEDKVANACNSKKHSSLLCRDTSRHVCAFEYYEIENSLK
jgi:hypothetical protein